jgi:hypothetical protein
MSIITRRAGSFASGVALTLLLAVAIPAWALECNNCVNGGDLVDGSVRSADLGAGAVGVSDIATGAVRARAMGTLPAVRVFNSANQDVPHGTVTAMSFNIEQVDTASMHDPANPTRLAIPRTGLYDLGYALVINNSDGDGYRKFWIRRSTGAFVWSDEVEPVAGIGLMSAHGSTIYRFTAGDYIELFVAQNSGSPLTVWGDTNVDEGVYPAFWARWVGP